MPTTFMDGPAAGQGFDLRRAPVRGRGGGGGRYEWGIYRYVPEVDGEALRDTAVWRAWADAQAVES